MMKLEQAPVTRHDIEAHGQQCGDENQREDINIESRNKGRQNKEEQNEGHNGQQPFDVKSILWQDNPFFTRPL
jgi:hypothetical protein